MVTEILQDLKENMDKAIVSLKNELTKVRTGRATTALVDMIMVECYGSLSPIKNIASVSVVDPKLISISPWDVSLVVAIDKAIRESDVGLNPVNDGKLLRIPIPPLSEERRKEMVKIVKKFGEDAKVAIRQVRREANDMIKELNKDKQISEDESKKVQAQIQKSTDDYTLQIDKLVETKEKDLMQV